MTRAWAFIGITALAAGAAFCQSADAPKPVVADVRVAAKTNGNQYLRPTPPRGGRYELRNATMLDLVRVANDFEADKVLGGPGWLEMNRYDVIIQVPANATPDTANTLLQSVLADRFRLVVHKETKPLPTWVLTAGKKPLMKEANGDGDAGCHPHTASAPPAPPGSGSGQLFTMGADGKVTMLTFGPGQTLQYTCHNVTMEAFAATIRGMIGNSIDTNVIDQTGLKGTWNFDVKYSFNFVMINNAGDDRIAFTDAVEKQLGLKMEKHPNPTPVLIVDSVDEKPSPNPPGVAEALPPPKVPAEFDVSDIKPTDPGTTFGRTINQPGGRFSSTGMSLSSVINNALMSNDDQVIGMPKFAESARYDITAKAAVDPGTNLTAETTSPLLIALLKERFGLKYHTEERTLPAYSLVSAKPKLKKADPASRTSCKVNNAPAPAPPGSIEMTCQNATMAQFVEQLRQYGTGLSIQPLDATGLEGGWDFTLSWNRRAGMNSAPPRGAVDGARDGPVTATDPDGGFTLFEAVDKQLGLKLEMQKRPVPVFVIDHLDEKPTDN